MKYIHESQDKENIKKDLAVIPFAYDLTGAVIESQYAGIIMAPARIEPRMSELIMVQNLLREKGIFELSKVLIFNRKLKLVDYHTSAIKSFQIDSLNKGLGLFDIFNIEELNISYNYMKEDSEDSLANILSHLKGLKTINLSSNDLKNGIASFFIVLNKLYREKKINLENLILNKCLLDDVAFYELGELLKSKYCKLKNLYLNMNNIPSNINFFKKLKKK
jgi:Ran GTPase-activating protein (RanGAP) involved in mRNA processing and transport